MSDEKGLTVVEEKQITVRYPSLQQWQLFEKFAITIFESHEFGSKTIQEIIIKAQYCWDYGLPLSAFSSLYIVNKRVATMSDMVAERLLSHPDFDYDVEDHTDDSCTIVLWRRSKRTGKFVKAGSSTYTMEDAKREGNASKEPYKKTPRNMMFARAITNAYKWYARNIFNVPINTIEEFGYDEDSIIEDDIKKVASPTKITVIEQEPLVITDEIIFNETPPIDSNISQYNIETTDKLLEVVGNAAIIFQVFGGNFPTTDDDIQFVVHQLVEEGFLAVDEKGDVFRVEAKEDDKTNS